MGIYYTAITLQLFIIIFPLNSIEKSILCLKTEFLLDFQFILMLFTTFKISQHYISLFNEDKGGEYILLQPYASISWKLPTHKVGKYETYVLFYLSKDRVFLSI